MSLSAIAETVAFINHRYNGAATTLVVYRLMDGNQVTIKYIGDSRVYLQRDNQWQCLTQDHTVLNELKKSRWYPAIKDLASAYDTLSNWLQIDTMATICLPHNTTQTTKIEQGDYLLLCTDGIYDLIALTQWGFIDSDTHLTDWLNALKIKSTIQKGRPMITAQLLLFVLSSFNQVAYTKTVQIYAHHLNPIRPKSNPPNKLLNKTAVLNIIKTP